MRTVLIDGLVVTKLGPGRCRSLLPERSRFSQIGHIIFRAVVALKTSVPFACRFVACSSRIKVSQTDTQTDRRSTVTLAEHARRGLIILKSIRAHLVPGSACVNCLYSYHILYLWNTSLMGYTANFRTVAF